MSSEPPPPARTVKPRKPGTSPLSVIALDRETILLERTGETFPITELPAVIVAEDSSLIVSEGMGEHLLRLHDAYADTTDFQYKLTPVYRDQIPLNGKASGRMTRVSTVASLVGFPGHYHYPVEPSTFIRLGINEIDSRTDTCQLVKLLEWAQNLREFLIANDLKIKPSAGGIAAQLLRDGRFYPQDRRKAPRIINAKVRDKLPGNYYRLNCELETPHDTVYLDMENSHHALAAQIGFPCVNTLRAYGYWDSDRPTIWATQGTRRFEEVVHRTGLLHVRLSCPHQPPGRFAPPCMGTFGEHDRWIYSNEIPFIKWCGGQVTAIYAAVVSNGIETGINKYAEWALAELDARPDQKPWLKPLLHSAYGVLASKPRPLEMGWRVAKGGEDSEYPILNKMVPVKVIKTKRAIEPKVVNVIHRGMIEAEQRVRSLELANELARLGGDVLCIYADSLFVTIKQLPLLPEPWRVKHEVTDLIFYSPTQFMSNELTRLPGIPRHMQADYAPAGKTRSLDPENGLPIRSDLGTRIFRPNLRGRPRVRPGGMVHFPG